MSCLLLEPLQEVNEGGWAHLALKACQDLVALLLMDGEMELAIVAHALR